MVKYNSITNSHHADFIEKALEKVKLRDMRGTEVAITEKIDGSNIGIKVENGTLQFQSRNQILCENAVFGNFQEVMERNALRDKLLEVAEKHFGPAPIIFFGEVFGGLYANQKGGIPIQKRINYCPKNEIMFFDIAIIHKTPEGEKLEYLPYFDFHKICDIWGLPQVPLIQIIDEGDFKSSLQKALEFSNEFETKVPTEIEWLENEGIIRDHKFEKRLPLENFAEGIVIRPYRFDLMVSDCDRFIIKSKHEKFGERNVKGVPQIADSINIKPYINENRVHSALSKYPANPNYGDIIKEVFADIFSDYEKDTNTTLDADTRKILQKRHSSQVFGILKGLV